MNRRGFIFTIPAVALIAHATAGAARVDISSNLRASLSAVWSKA
jgi:hypothetical protein